MSHPFTDETREKLYEAYEDVRNDKTDTRWFVATYPDGGKVIDLTGTGVDYAELLNEFTEDNRCYAYARFETGDEMSRRAKFAFITWIGPSVSPLKKAKVSTDKAFIKQVVSNFGKEILADERGELEESKVLKILEAASGASYGTGK